MRSDIVAVWSGTNDTDKKQQELVITLFNDLIVVAQSGSKRGTLKFKEAVRIGNVKIKEAKIRKWASKRATLGGNTPKPVMPTDKERRGSGERRGSDAGEKMERRLSDAVDRPRSGSHASMKGGSLVGNPFCICIFIPVVYWTSGKAHCGTGE